MTSQPRRSGAPRPGTPSRADAWCAPGAPSPPEGLHVGLAVEDPAEFTADAFKQALLQPRHQGQRRSRQHAHKYSDRHRRFRRRAREAAQASPVRAHHGRRRSRGPPRAGRAHLALWPRTSPSSTRPARISTPNCCCACWARPSARTAALKRARAWCASSWSMPASDDNEFFFYDGSGMSPWTRSRRAPSRNCCVRVASAMGRRWRETLPVAGVDGTLDHRFNNSPLKGQLWAKTGTLNEVNALSGYLTAASGKTGGLFHSGQRPLSRQRRGACRPSTASPKPLPPRSNG